MDLTSNSFSDAFFGDYFNSNSCQMDDYTPGYVSLNRSWPLTMSMKTLVICNSSVYVCSDDENVDLLTERNRTRNVEILAYNARTVYSENRSRDDDKFTDSPGTSKVHRTDSNRTTTIRTCSRNMIRSKIPVYIKDNSQGTSKANRRPQNLYTKGVPFEPDMEANDNNVTEDGRDSESDECLDDSSSPAKSSETFDKYSHVKDQNKDKKQYKYEEKKSKLINSGANTDEQTKECAEKWTYCRPVLNLYNREVRFKYMEKVNKLQKIVRQIADAREREKQMEAWRNRTVTDIRAAETIVTPDPAIDWRKTPALVENHYNKKFGNTQSEQCKALLVDIFGPTMGIVKPQIKDKNEGNNNKQDELTDDKPKIPKRTSQKDASCYPIYLIRKCGTKPGDNNFRAEKFRSEGIEFEPFISQTKLVNNKSMCFPTASLTLLHSGKSSKEEQKKITRDSNVNTNASLRYKLEFSNLNKQKSAEEVRQKSNVRKAISKHGYNIYDDEDNIRTNLFIRNYIHDYQPQHSGINRRNTSPGAKDKQYSGKTREKRNNCKKPCCNYGTNTEITTPSYNNNHYFVRNDIMPRRKELVSILKNKPCDEVMPDYDNNDYEYIILEPTVSTPFDTETICFPTKSNTYFSHSSNESESDHHFHGQKKYDKPKSRKRARKTKVIVRKKVAKPKTYSITTQTERVSSFESVRRLVRYRDDPNGSPSRNTRGDDDKKEEEERKSSNVSRKKFDGTKEDIITEEPESYETAEQKTTDESESEKKETKDKYNKYSNSIAKRQSQDEDSLTNRRINSKDGTVKSAESSPKANTSGISNKSKVEERKLSSQQSYKRDKKDSRQQGSDNLNRNNTPPKSSTPRGSDETKAEINMTKPKQNSRERNSFGSPKSEGSKSKQPLNEETDNQIEEVARPVQEEFEKISEDVARLKSRNRESNSSTHMKNLEDKLDLLIGAINHLVNQLQNKCKETETEEETFQPTCDFNECISRKPTVSENTNTTNKRRSSQGNAQIRRKCNKSDCQTDDCIIRNSDTSDSIKQIYVDNNAGTSGGARKTSTEENVKGNNNSRVVNTLYFDPEDNPMQNYINSTKNKQVETKSVSQMIQQTSSYRIIYPNNNKQSNDVMYSMYNPKIEQILQEEIGKSDQAKKEIEDIINGDFQSQTLKTAVDVPTRERSTEVTASLSKTKIIQINTNTLDEEILSSTLSGHGKIHCKHVHKINKDRREMVDASGTTKRCLTINLDTIPLGILGLLRVSTNTIYRILSFMQESLPCSSLLPMSQIRQLEVPQYVCNLCKAVFGQSSEFQEHMQSQHRVPSVRDCCVCRHLLELQKARGRAGLFTCKYCGQVYTRAYCCELHQQTCARRHGRKPSVSGSLSILR